MSKKILKYMAAFSGSEVILFLGSFISFPILTRILTKEDYGIMAVISVTVSFASILSGMGLKESILRFYSSYDEKEKSNFLSTIFYSTLMSALLIAMILICVLVLLILLRSTLGRYYLYSFLIASLLIIIRIVTANIMALYRVEEKVRYVIFIDLATRYGGLIASVLLVILFRNLYGYFAGLSLAEGILAIYLVYLIRDKISYKNIQLKLLPEAIRYGFPLSMSNISIYFLMGGNRYFVGYFLGAGAIATYTVVYNLCNYIFELVKNIFYNTFMPLVMNHWNRNEVQESEKLLSLHFRLYVMLTIPAIFGLTSLGAETLSLVAGEKYTGAYYLIPYLASAIAVNGLSQVTFSGLYYKSDSRKILAITIGCAVLNAILNLALIPWMGLVGSAWATGITYISMVIIGYFFTLERLNIRYSIINVAKYICMSFIMVLVLSHVPLAGVFGFLVKTLMGCMIYGGLLIAIEFKFMRTVVASLRK